MATHDGARSSRYDDQVRIPQHLNAQHFDEERTQLVPKASARSGMGSTKPNPRPVTPDLEEIAARHELVSSAETGGL